MTHAYGGRRLTLHAVFTDEALSVREAERRLAAGEALSPSSLEQVMELTVDERREGQQ
ncbi:MAG: hypothetical protein HY901_29230 [Deltaproteobacteria bacterium]|nr:hypothetical protein [Deltaproteobacteria bacterium]